MVSRRRLLTAAPLALAAPFVLDGPASAEPAGQLIALRYPIRVYDSRESPGPFGWNGRKLQPPDAPNISVGFVGDGGPLNAVFLNVTVTQTEGGGYLTLVPTDLSGERPLPLTSNINWWDDDLELGNSSLVAVGGESSIEVHIRGGLPGRPTRAHVILDVQGFIPYNSGV